MDDDKRKFFSKAPFATRAPVSRPSNLPKQVIGFQSNF